MLKILRNKKTARKVWIFLALIIIPAFVFWGTGSIIRNKENSGYAGIIFGRKIPLLAYKDAFEATKNQAIIQYGENFAQIQQYLNLEMLAWERLVLLAQAKKEHIKVSDKEVIGLIQSYPFFSRQGRFDKALYAQILRYAFRTPERRFEEETREKLMLEKLFNKITEKIKLTDAQIKEEYRKVNEEISVYYIASLYDDFKKNIAVNEKDIADYYAKNSLQFKQPLSFNAQYVTSESEEEIKKIYLNLQKEKDLVKVAKNFDMELRETGLFGQIEPIPGFGSLPQLSVLISRLEIGRFTQPILIENKYYIFGLKERKEPYVPEFKSIIEKVKEAFVQEEAQKIAKQKIEECFKDKALLSNFNKAAKIYGLKTESTTFFKFGTYLKNIGQSDAIWIAAGKLKENENSSIIEMPSGFYIIKLKAKIGIDQKKFEAEREEFAKKLLTQKQQETFVNFVDELKKNTRLF